MRACKQCGLSVGDRATFCQVCGAIVEPLDAAAAAAPAAAARRPRTPAECEARAYRCRGTDPARAAALYRQAIVDHLDSSDDPLGDKATRRDLQRLFDRLSTLLRREGLHDEALEEINAAASLGLVDDEGADTDRTGGPEPVTGARAAAS